MNLSLIADFCWKHGQVLPKINKAMMLEKALEVFGTTSSSRKIKSQSTILEIIWKMLDKYYKSKLVMAQNLKILAFWSSSWKISKNKLTIKKLIKYSKFMMLIRQVYSPRKCGCSLHKLTLPTVRMSLLLWLLAILTLSVLMVNQ